jgi:hypothetical protein
MRFPGVIHWKQQQDEQLAPADHYIRRVIKIPESAQDEHEEDELSLDNSDVLRIVICMSREGSERLLKAQYLSSDISFKRVNDFYEFEIACIDRISNSSECLIFSQLVQPLMALLI